MTHIDAEGEEEGKQTLFAYCEAIRHNHNHFLVHLVMSNRIHLIFKMSLALRKTSKRRMNKSIYERSFECVTAFGYHYIRDLYHMSY